MQLVGWIFFQTLVLLDPLPPFCTVPSLSPLTNVHLPFFSKNFAILYVSKLCSYQSPLLYHYYHLLREILQVQSKQFLHEQKFQNNRHKYTSFFTVCFPTSSLSLTKVHIRNEIVYSTWRHLVAEREHYLPKTTKNIMFSNVY